MNQTIVEASLDHLHDIIVPEAVGYFPLAPGWVVLVLLALALLFHFAIQIYAKYKKSLYRREGLKELESFTEQSQEETVELLSLAKRVAIAAYGRETIAKLSADSWWDFMEKHSKVKVSSQLRKNIAKILYDKSYESNHQDYNAIKTFVTLWIKTHKGIKDV